MARKTKKQTEILVKVVQMGAKTEEVALAPGATVEDALLAADMSTDVTVKINGEVVDLTDEVEDGDRLTIADKAKGAR